MNHNFVFNNRKETDKYSKVDAYYICTKCRSEIIYHYSELFKKNTEAMYSFHKNLLLVRVHKLHEKRPSIEEAEIKFYEMTSLNCEELMVNEIMNE